jgi:uroporphyrinogen III methyltransferase/synthase
LQPAAAAAQRQTKNKAARRKPTPPRYHQGVTPAESPLAGWRILITRPAEQIAPFAGALSAAGAVAISYPTIRLAPPESWQPLDQALADSNGYDWAVFTSPSAVRFTLNRAGVSSFKTMKLAAVGTETARALTSFGLIADVVPPDDEQRQEGLVQALAALGRGTRVLFPQTVGGRELLKDRLVGQGCRVDIVPVSRTVAVKPSAPPPPFDVATFASPSALRAFVDAWGAGALAGKIVAAIGPTTAAAAAEAHVKVGVMPARPSIPTLIDALIAYRATLG